MPCGKNWLQTDGKDWLQTQDGRDWLQTKGGRDWLQTQSGQDWLQTPHGKEWQSTPAASTWVAMEEFSSTLEAISEYKVIPEYPPLPAFQAIQQFKNLPDFLMFPVFLALRHQDHSTSAPPEGRFPPDEEIIHATNAFATFANGAQERSQSASDALKYACQNWAVHLFRARNPWDDTLSHIFKAFWSRHLLAWLERQWCLKGLRSCLVVLSTVQTLAKLNQILPAIDPDSENSTKKTPPAPTSNMPTREPSTTPPAGQLVVTPHASAIPRPRFIQHTLWRTPSTPPPSLPPAPSLNLNVTDSDSGISKKRTSDELRIDNHSPLESVPTPSKRPKRDEQSSQPKAGESSTPVYDGWIYPVGQTGTHAEWYNPEPWLFDAGLYNSAMAFGCTDDLLFPASRVGSSHSHDEDLDSLLICSQGPTALDPAIIPVPGSATATAEPGSRGADPRTSRVTLESGLAS
ncbi:hypothetical protein DFH29DRAFT_1072961 [Suillus ampliporus]|nr:hypothetical protein DFH29DRAFT_1072961 [Suillus ampliporus]